MIDPVVLVLGRAGPDRVSVCDALRPMAHAEPVDDVRSALGLLGHDEFDLVVVLDDGPRAPALDQCRGIRARSNLPLIVVSGRDSELDTVLALELGADDYITLPLDDREFVARCRLVLRRCASGEVSRGHDAGRRYSVGDLVVDPPGRCVVVSGRSVSLTARELAVLSKLVLAGGRVVTRRELTDSLGPGNDERGARLDFVLKRLRAKVEQRPAAPSRIVTVWGRGFRYVRHDSI